MPLTDFQRSLLAVLAGSPNDDRYLAGGAALHFAPNSARDNDDLEFFHDSEARVAAAFAADRATLEAAGYHLDLELSLPGFIRAVVRRGADATRVDWALDSAWRFMPLVRDPLGGLLLHPVDLAFGRLRLTEPFDLVSAKETWLGALGEADRFARGRPPEGLSCLYYSTGLRRFVVPRAGESLGAQESVPHLGAPGGVLPRPTDARVEGLESAP